MKLPSLFTSLLCLASASASAELAPIELEFPPPYLEGTPVPVRLPNLESGQVPAPSIMAPAGIANIAAGKEVTSSDDFPIIGELDMITDGDKESGEGYYVELTQGLQWVQIDLGAPATIYGIGLWHFHSQRRAYIDVIVQISNDPEFKDGVEVVFNNDHDNSARLGAGKDRAYIETNRGRLIDANKQVGRYVRLYSNGNTSNEMNHYVEVEVFGEFAAQ